MQFVQDQQSPLEAPLSWLRQPRAGAQALRSQSAFRGLPREVAEPSQATPASLPQPVAWRWCGPDRHTRCSIERRSRLGRPSRRLASCRNHADAANGQCRSRGRQDQGDEEATPEQATEQLRERRCGPSCRSRNRNLRRRCECSGRHGKRYSIQHDSEQCHVATPNPWRRGHPMAAGYSKLPEHHALVNTWSWVWHLRTGFSNPFASAATGGPFMTGAPGHIMALTAVTEPSVPASRPVNATAMDTGVPAPTAPASPSTDFE